MNREGSTDTYILPCVKQPASGKLLNGHKEPDLVLCGSLEEWDGMGGGGGSGGRGRVCTRGWFTLLCGRSQHNIVAIILQLNIKK